MRPFRALWTVSLAILRARQEYVWQRQVHGFSFFEIKNGEVHMSGNSTRFNGGLLDRMKLFILPDMKFLINNFDEPRVFSASSTDDSNEDRDMIWHEHGHSTTSSLFKLACLPSENHGLVDTPHHFAFISNTTLAQDFCSDSGLLKQHGFLQRPSTLSITHQLVPVLSSCAPAHFQDILLPSPGYDIRGGLDNADTIDSSFQLPWEDNRDKLHWVGSSTGMYATADDWRNGHRRRIAMAFSPKNSDAEVRLLAKPSTPASYWTEYSTPFSTLQNLFDVKVNKITQYLVPACREMSSVLLSDTSNALLDDANMSSDYEYVLDIDGNTWSGRFHRFLHSRSCVLKMTIFRDAHDDRLTPWVHYVPISFAAEELPETMRFLTQDPRGREIGRDIAEAGRLAAKRYLRDVDADVVTLRVLLELARVLHDDD